MFLLLDPSAANSATIDRIAEFAATAIFSAFASGFFVWLFARKKTGSEIHKTESETFQTYIGIIRDLQNDINGFVEKTKTLRIESAALELIKSDSEKKWATRDRKLAKLLKTALTGIQRITPLLPGPKSKDPYHEMIRIEECVFSTLRELERDE